MGTIAEDESGMLMSRLQSRLHKCTDARNTPQKRHSVPLFGTFSAASTRDGSLGKALQHHEIGHEPCSAKPSRS